jgi:hypothetical protein
MQNFCFLRNIVSENRKILSFADEKNAHKNPSLHSHESILFCHFLFNTANINGIRSWVGQELSTWKANRSNDTASRYLLPSFFLLSPPPKKNTDDSQIS